MPRKTTKPAISGKSAQPKISAKVLEELIPGPVTKEEYESRAERYDQQIITEMGLDPKGMSTEEKMALHREWRTGRFSKLMDSVYTRRGWTLDGVPTLERLQELGLDAFPEVVEVVKQHL